MNFDVVTLVAIVGISVAAGSFIFAIVQLRQQAAQRARRLSGNGATTHALGLDKESSSEFPYAQIRNFQLVRPDSSCQIGIVTGTILNVKDAAVWVNAENTDMVMARFAENSISAIIRYFGGKQDSAGHVTEDVIANELRSVVGPEKPVAPGSAFVTTSGALLQRNNVRNIIHVAAVQGEPGAGFRQVLNVGLCVTNALTQLDKLAARDPQVSSILFPLLGTGVGGAEIESTIHVLVGAAIKYLDDAPDTAIKKIYFLAYSYKEFAAFTRVMESMPRLKAAGDSDAS